MNVIEGKMTQDGIKVGIVVARFNEFITAKLLGGAKDGRELSRYHSSQRRWQRVENTMQSSASEQ